MAEWTKHRLNEIADFNPKESIKKGEEAIKIGLTTDENSRDEYNEYLVITLQGGETCTFRNSYVDLFRV